MKNKLACTVEYYHHYDYQLERNIVEVCFRNEITNQELWKVYKTKSAAQAQATKFQNRMTRIYG